MTDLETKESSQDGPDLHQAIAISLVKVRLTEHGTCGKLTVEYYSVEQLQKYTRHILQQYFVGMRA